MPTTFDKSKRTEGDWRITWNPLAWGNSSPEIVVLGFSKGPTQAGVLSTTAHDAIAYKGSRSNVGKILAHVGLLPSVPSEQLSGTVDRLIADKEGRFHFASLVRCTVERYDRNTVSWKGSGGGMLDKFVALPFGRQVAARCATNFLGTLPSRTKLVVMFGLGSKLNYVDSALEVFRSVRKGAWRKLNAVSYTDSDIVVVHVEHFASQGKLIPEWLGIGNTPRADLGKLAKQAVAGALASREPMSTWTCAES